MDDGGVPQRRGYRVYPVIDDADPYGVGSSGPAVQAGSGLTAPRLAEVTSCRSHPLGPLPDSEKAVSFSSAHASVTRPNSPRTRVSPFAIPEKQSAFHRRGQ